MKGISKRKQQKCFGKETIIMLLVNKIIKFSNVDGPGNRMAIFLQGCNYDCDYCHNPETIGVCSSCKKCVPGCPVGALKKEGKKVVWDEEACVYCDKCIKTCPKNASPLVKHYEVDELMEEIKKVAPFIKGITISGGESTLQYKELTELFRRVKEETGLTCFIDTNGSLPLWEERYGEFLEVTDSFMLDVKAWDKKIHKKLTGQGNINVKKNLEYLLEEGKLFEVRTVIVPGKGDNEETVEEVSKVIAGRGVRYKIISYRNLGVRRDRLQGIGSPDEECMKELRERSQNLGVEDVLIV